MLDFLETLRKEHTDDESIRAFTEIENHLRDKKYGLVWEEHSERVDEMLEKNIPIFTEDTDKKITAAAGGVYNFILEGDNLQSLYLLEKTHKGLIDVIYIDPPYNTMNEGFTYSDQLVDGNDSFRHSKWMSFMYRRLLFAKKLLSDRGIIFISVDENEYAQLKLLCDDIFDEKCFVENIIWNKRVPKNDKGIGNIHEYILTYVANTSYKYKLMSPKEGMSEITALIHSGKAEGKTTTEVEQDLRKLYKKEKYPRAITLYNNLDNNYRVFGKINMSWPNGNTFGPRYDVKHPITGKPVKVPDRGWRWSEKTFNEAVDYQNPQSLPDGSVICGRIWFSAKDNMQPSSINYLDEVDRMLLRSIISIKSDGGMVLENIFDQKSTFAYPKPVTLIKMLIDACTYDKTNALILDFFAGSGTTGQAVLELNAEDEKNRQFILCTNNENQICDAVTYPRTKTVITGVRQNGSSYSDAIPANLKYFKCDWTPRKPEEYLLSNVLCLHIREMIELLNGIEVDNAKNVLILNKADFRKYVMDDAVYAQIENIWVNQNIIFNSMEMEKLNALGFKYIPREFFGQELREAAE